MFSILLAAILSVAPPPDSNGDAVAALEAALEQVGTAEPATSITELEAALAAAAQQPQLANNEAAQAKLDNARLSLAWLHLASGNQAAAEAAMDEALRSARGKELDAGQFGPKVIDLHEARKAALLGAGTASLEIACEVPCALVVNEQAASNPATGLVLGTYRVWISATEGEPGWSYHEVELGTAGATETLTFEDPTPDVVPVDRPVDTPKLRKRAMPRWAEIVGMAAGAGLIAGGAVFMAFNGKCQGGGDPATCPKIYDNTIQGVSLLAAGGAVFLTFGAMLTVDEVRVGRAKGRQAMLTWTMRF